MLERTTLAQLAALGAALYVSLASACSGEGTPGSGGSTSAGAGGSTTSKSASSATASTTGAFSTTSVASTGASVMTAACDSAFIDVDTPQGTLHLTSSCPDPWEIQSAHPVAYFMSVGAVAGDLHIAGCLAPSSFNSGITVLGLTVDPTQPGVAPAMIGSYVDASATMWLPTGTGGQITITKITGKTGETVEGSFSAPASANGQTVILTGTFRACKIDDLQAP